MNDDERLATALLHRSVDDVTLAPAPLEDLLLAGRRSRRRRTGAVIASTVAAVLAIGGLSGFVATRVHGGSDASDGASQPTARHPTGPAMLPAPPGMRLIGYRGIGVVVPRAWSSDTRLCRAEGILGRGCSYWAAPATGVRAAGVWITSATGSDGLAGRARPTTTSDGMRVERVAPFVVHRSEAGVPQYEGAILVDDGDLAFVVDSRSKAMVDRILDSAFVIPHGYVAVPAYPTIPALHRVGLNGRIGNGYMGMYPDHTTLSSVPPPGTVVRRGSTVALEAVPDGPPWCANPSITVHKPGTTVVTKFDSDGSATVHMAVRDQLRVVASGSCATGARLSAEDESLLARTGEHEFTAVGQGMTTVQLALPACSGPEVARGCRGGLTTAEVSVRIGP